MKFHLYQVNGARIFRDSAVIPMDSQIRTLWTPSLDSKLVSLYILLQTAVSPKIYSYRRGWVESTPQVKNLCFDTNSHCHRICFPSFIFLTPRILLRQLLIMPDNKGDRAVTDLHTPPEGQPLLGYPMPEPEAPVDPTLPAPATLDPATAAAIGRQYRDQCEFHPQKPREVTYSKFQYTRDALWETTSRRQSLAFVALSRPS